VVLLLPLIGCLRRPGPPPTEMTYKLPTTIVVAKGESIPGTDIVYLSFDEERGAELRIKGQIAYKRKGDSVNWSGTPLPGVDVSLKLRVIWCSESELRLVGTARIHITDVHPKEAPIFTTSPLKYSGPVAYGLAKGATIPGSLITYEGQENGMAKLGGIKEYPYRETGDSIYWEGQLRDDVFIRLELRAIQFDEKGMRVAGLATLWLGR